jgi:hypothetical protein
VGVIDRTCIIFGVDKLKSIVKVYSDNLEGKQFLGVVGITGRGNFKMYMKNRVQKLLRATYSLQLRWLE